MYSRNSFSAAPVQLPQAPFLGAIVQTEDGIMQLIAVERIREMITPRCILDQGARSDPNSLKGKRENLHLRI